MRIFPVNFNFLCIGMGRTDKGAQRTRIRLHEHVTLRREVGVTKAPSMVKVAPFSAANDKMSCGSPSTTQACTAMSYTKCDTFAIWKLTRFLLPELITWHTNHL
jgi:hypothetical protein